MYPGSQEHTATDPCPVQIWAHPPLFVEQASTAEIILEDSNKQVTFQPFFWYHADFLEFYPAGKKVLQQKVWQRLRS